MIFNPIDPPDSEDPPEDPIEPVCFACGDQLQIPAPGAGLDGMDFVPCTVCMGDE